MARFFSYEEVVRCDLTPVDDLRWIAGQVAQLPPFAAGDAVLCGSICWGSYSWRSDIDIAHFSTIEHPHVERAVADVMTQYAERTQHRFIRPHFDAIAVGAESLALAKKSKSVSAPSVSAGTPVKREKVSNLFTETAVLFADHIGALAELNGHPWRAFLDKYLSAANGDRHGRREATKRYVGAMTAEWAAQPLHDLNLGPGAKFNQQQLDLIGKWENYPTNLMRRILGESGKYPRPDRGSDIRDAFLAVQQPWSKKMLDHFEPFFSLHQEYEGLVAACKTSQTPLSEPEYYRKLRALFVGLPFMEIQQSIWEYLRS